MLYELFDDIRGLYLIPAIMLGVLVLLSIYRNEKDKMNLIIFLLTIGMHVLFIVLNRNMFRVVFPGYILGSALLIYNTQFKIKWLEWLVILAIPILLLTGNSYNLKYDMNNYAKYKELINYTSSQSEGVYLSTVPGLQLRFRAYSVYEMPPKESFANLRVMGSWDMYTQNYYDFKNRHDLDGTFLDLLKENVYLIDGTATWGGSIFRDYINCIVLFIKENYNIDVSYERVKEFGNVYIYKLEAL